MSERNYFIKLIMFFRSNTSSLLLYGFSSTTKQDCYPWQEERGSKKNGYICKAILEEEDYKILLEQLKKPGEVSIGKKSFVSPQLLERPTVLSNDGFDKEPGPIQEYRALTEFWNIDKEGLYNNITEEYREHKIKGKELYLKMLSLFNWVQEECNINMLMNGHRLGNFECYHPLKHEDAFQVDSHKELNLLKTTVRKTKAFHKNLIVNCVSKHHMRTITNQSKIFLPEESVLEFNAEEAMSEILVQIWDQDSGELIFSLSYSLMMSLSMGIGFNSPTYKIKDSWTKQLFDAASNRKEWIEKNIEGVTYTNFYKKIVSKSNFQDEIDTAIEKSDNIFSRYQNIHGQGIFVKNNQKDGEIQSFIKVNEYLEASSIEKVIIVDPFFSVFAAEKILPRVSRRDIEITIITALGEVNADNGEKRDENQAEALKSFLKKNVRKLHPKLLVYNLETGKKKQAFHGRYLLRYHRNGAIDGFMLSNSLNSMGQFYPFVAVPMDYKVCLEILDYFRIIFDESTNKKKDRRKISCERIYDSKDMVCTKSEEEAENLPYLDWFNQWRDEKNNVRISKEDIPKAVSIVMQRWKDDADLACKMLCYIGLVVRSHFKYKEIKTVIENQTHTSKFFLEKFIPLAGEIESMRDYDTKGILSEEYAFWSLLNKEAKPDRIGFAKKIPISGGHIYYGPEWLKPGYNILLLLYPEEYLELMKKLQSPLMFDTLIYELSKYTFPTEWIPVFIENGNKSVQLLFAEHMLHKLCKNQNFFGEYKRILRHLTKEKALMQMAYMLSRLTFYYKVNFKKRKNYFHSIYTWLMGVTAEKIHSCSKIDREEALYYLYANDPISNCRLHYKLASCIPEGPVKEQLLEITLEIIERELIDYMYVDKTEKVDRLEQLYVKLLDMLYKNTSEEELFSRFIKWPVFETATEPELKNYNYDKWYEALKRGQRQLEILHIYFKTHSDSEKVKKWIGLWEDRMNQSCSLLNLY